MRILLHYRRGGRHHHRRHRQEQQQQRQNLLVVLEVVVKLVMSSVVLKVATGSSSRRSRTIFPSSMFFRDRPFVPAATTSSVVSAFNIDNIVVESSTSSLFARTRIRRHYGHPVLSQSSFFTTTTTTTTSPTTAAAATTTTTTTTRSATLTRDGTTRLHSTNNGDNEIDIYNYFDKINDDDGDGDADGDPDADLSLGAEDDTESDDDDDDYVDVDEYRLPGSDDENEVGQEPEQEERKIHHHANIYSQWTLDDDRRLWELYTSTRKPTTDENNEKAVVVNIASMLGRGIHGVSSRIAKLKNVDSSAYRRLFVDGSNTKTSIENGRGVDGNEGRIGTGDKKSKKVGKNKKKKKKGGNNRYDDDDDDNDKYDIDGTKNKKLVPITEVLRRIEYDPTLIQSDFSIRYYDRVEDQLLNVNFDEPNTNISGPPNLSFIKALPEHRIQSVYYKSRKVWDRETKLDLIFGRNTKNIQQEADAFDGDETTTTTAATMGISNVIETYPQWEEEQRRLVQMKEERKRHIEYTMTRMLGIEYYNRFTNLMDGLYNVHNDPSTSTKQYIENDFVPQALSIISEIRDDPAKIQQYSMDPSLIPKSDWLALDLISEYVAATVDGDEDDLDDLRSQTLWEIFFQMNRIDGGKLTLSPSSRLIGDDGRSETMIMLNTSRGMDAVQPIVLNEEELEETFVRGSGPGGQKINKTSNRVILTHIPTQVRVECQDTRSLQQNRKIARKRLRLKLDEYYNGRQSKVQQQHIKASQKRQKSKAKNRARQRKKQIEKQLQRQEQEQEFVDDDIDQY